MEVTVDGVIYEVNNGTAKVCSLAKIEPIVQIRETVCGYPVVGIGAKAFLAQPIKEVIIPPSIRTIEEYAFCFCSDLKTVRLEQVQPIDSCTEIQTMAFAFCSQLTSIRTCSELVLQKNCFSKCTVLKNMDLIKEINGSVFDNCLNLKRIDFSEDCCLQQFLNDNTSLEVFNFGGDAYLSFDLIDGMKKQKIKVNCFTTSNVCDLAYEGISVNAIDPLF